MLIYVSLKKKRSNIKSICYLSRLKKHFKVSLGETSAHVVVYSHRCRGFPTAYGFTGDFSKPGWEIEIKCLSSVYASDQ